MSEDNEIPISWIQEWRHIVYILDRKIAQRYVFELMVGGYYVCVPTWPEVQREIQRAFDTRSGDVVGEIDMDTECVDWSNPECVAYLAETVYYAWFHCSYDCEWASMTFVGIKPVPGLLEELAENSYDALLPGREYRSGLVVLGRKAVSALGNRAVEDGSCGWLLRKLDNES